MKVSFRVIICLIFSNTILGGELVAQNRWTQLYYEDEDAFGSNIALTYDNTCFLIGKHGHNYENYNWLLKLNINGEILWEKTFGEDSSKVNILNIEDNNQGDIYLVGLTSNYSEDDYDPLIMKLNACGEKQWCRVFIADGMNFASELKVTPDGGLVVVLIQMSPPSLTDPICIAKFDLNGNLQWKQCYISPDTSVFNSDAFDLTLAPDGGFLITGICSYEDPNPPHYWWWKPYYIKTDSSGNFEWEMVVHKEVSDVGGDAWNTVLSPDQKFYYSSISHYYHSAGDAPALLKMDLAGNVVDIYDLADPNEYGKMIEAKFLTESTLMASATWGQFGGPKAVIIDTLGNILLQADLLDNQWMAYTEVTFDGKLLFFTNINDDNGNFDAYLFKLNQQLQSDSIYTQVFTYDSLCPYPIVSDTIVQDNCELIVSNSFIANVSNHSLMIYPNPAYESFILKTGNMRNNSATVEIFDLFGQKIKSAKITKGQSELIVPVVTWQKGLYLVRLKYSDGTVESGKVVVN